MRTCRGLPCIVAARVLDGPRSMGCRVRLPSKELCRACLQVLADVAAGRIKLLFGSPERLGNPHRRGALRPRMPLPLVVVDEAHCVAGAPGSGSVATLPPCCSCAAARSRISI